MSIYARAHLAGHTTLKRMLLAAVLACLSLPLLAPASSAADAVFEIDGGSGGANFVVNTPGNLDWESVLDGPVANDNSPAETTVFKTSSKENNAVSTWRDGNDAAPPKTDTKELYEWSRLNSDDEIEFYFGWERDKPNGTLFYTLELNAKPNVPGVGGGTDFTVPNRTAGDHRFSLKDQGGGIIALVQIDEWTGTAWDCTDGAAAGCDEPIAAGAFLGSVNLVSASWPAGWAGSPHTAPADTFVETGFNLTELIGLTPGCPGLTGFLNFRSSTGSTSSSTGENLKDYIKPLRIDGPNDCRDDLAVTKTATATFTRTFNWGIAKGNDATYNMFAGQSVNHPYTVDLTRSSADSAWSVTGDITVTNPNDDPITGVALTDTVNNGGSCSVTSGTGLSVPANGSLTRAYSCTWAAAPSAGSGTNTATATWDATANKTPTGTASGTAGFAFTTPTVVNGSVNVSDEGSGDPGGLVSGSDSQDFGPFTAAGNAASYSRTFSCPAAASAYDADGKFSYTYVNVATIDETGANDSANVTVNCARALASKTAAGTYDERHTWDVTKSVAPASQHAFAGANAPYEWTVGVTETVTEASFLVSGTVTVVNPSSSNAMTVTLSDQLNDGTPGVIQSCSGGTWTANTSTLVVPAGGTATCTYRATPTGRTATTNTLTATVNGQITTATDAIEWTANPIDASVTLDDDQNPAFPLTISNGDTWTYVDSGTCSTDPTRYTNGTYTITDPNTATIKRGTTLLDSASATATVICHAPVVTKTADEAFTRGWEWVVVKDFDAQYDLDAGESVTHGYRVKVTPTATDNSWRVTGQITIANSHPTAAMVLGGVTDNAGGISADVSCPSLTVPANGTLVCTYDTGAQNSPGTNPFGATNTATATFAAVGWTGTAPITFPATPTTEVDAVIHVDDDNLTGENFTADRSETTWTYDKDFTCPTDPTSYTNGIHEIHHVNKATIVETNAFDTARVDVTCHRPPGATLLIIDEDSIDNGIHYARGADRITPDGPLFFSDSEVNDDKPGHTQRDVLRFFQTNVGQQITVKTGQTGDEGWFAPNCIPQKWISGGSNACLNGANRDTAIDNFFGIGPVPNQSRLDKIPAVMPLRALGLNSLVGHDVCAVVYDSDLSINYDSTSFPYTSGNLQGETLGVVAFHVDETSTLNGFSSSTLPQVTLTINNTSGCGAWQLFNAPVPNSSSEPNDRIAPGSQNGYRALLTRALEPLFY